MDFVNCPFWASFHIALSMDHFSCDIQYNRALEKEGGSPERDGGEEGEEGLVWADSSSWILNNFYIQQTEI